MCKKEEPFLWHVWVLHVIILVFAGFFSAVAHELLLLMRDEDPSDKFRLLLQNYIQESFTDFSILGSLLDGPQKQKPYLI